MLTLKYSFNSPLGQLIYEIHNDYLYSMYFAQEKEDVKDKHPVLDEQLTLFFEGKLKKINFMLEYPYGTEFQKSVWDALLHIPYGETRSYLDIAKAIGNQKAVRAVGQACKRNPIGLVVPCHRVIGSNGAMTGYSGKAYVDLKKRILDYEKEHA